MNQKLISFVFNHKHMLKNGPPPHGFEDLYRLLIREIIEQYTILKCLLSNNPNNIIRYYVLQC